MNLRAPCLLAVFLLLCFSGMASAHRVNVFAFADGREIQVECSFSKSQKVRNGKLVISDLETGRTILEGITDEQGLFRFRPPDEFLRSGHGLNILLQAGEGHQNHWQISAEELRALESAPEYALPQAARQGDFSGKPPAASPDVPDSGREAASATPVPRVLPGGQQAAAIDGMNARELENLIGRVVDAKLAPVKQALARQEEQGPGIRDIVGGLGWIIGLLGVAAYMKYRP